MAKHPDRPVYAFVRKGNALVPDMAQDLRALEGIAQGEKVRIDIKQWRNLDRLRAYWAMLGEVVEATECAPTVEKLHEVLKLENGFVDLISLPNGLKVAVPSSIAFEKMDEATFQKFFAAAQRWLAENYGYVPPAKDERRAA